MPSDFVDILILIDDCDVVIVSVVDSVVASVDFKAPRRVGLSASCLSPFDPTPSGRSVRTRSSAHCSGNLVRTVVRTVLAPP